MAEARGHLDALLDEREQEWERAVARLRDDELDRLGAFFSSRDRGGGGAPAPPHRRTATSPSSSRRRRHLAQARVGAPGGRGPPALGAADRGPALGGRGVVVAGRRARARVSSRRGASRLAAERRRRARPARASRRARTCGTPGRDAGARARDVACVACGPRQELVVAAGAMRGLPRLTTDALSRLPCSVLADGRHLPHRLKRSPNGRFRLSLETQKSPRPGVRGGGTGRGRKSGWASYAKIVLGVLGAIVARRRVPLFNNRSRSVQRGHCRREARRGQRPLLAGRLRALAGARQAGATRSTPRTPSGIDAHRLAGDAPFWNGDFKNAVAEYRNYLERTKKGVLADAGASQLGLRARERRAVSSRRRRSTRSWSASSTASSSAEFLVAAGALLPLAGPAGGGDHAPQARGRASSARRSTRTRRASRSRELTAGGAPTCDPSGACTEHAPR